MQPQLRFILCFLWLGWAATWTQLSGQNLSVTFGADSLYACQDSSFSTGVTVSGGQGTVAYLWQDGTQASTWSLAAAQTDQLITVQVIDGNQDTASASAWLIVLPECVFPGDADGNRKANNYDLLTMGLVHGSAGPLRPAAHHQFIGQAAPAWGSLTLSGTDRVHGDADGNGTVDLPDYAVLTQNYQTPQTENSTLWDSQNGIPLTLDISNSVANPGDTVHLQVMVGSVSHPVDSLYGLAFTLTYDLGILAEGATKVDFSDSWLGTEGVDLVGIHRSFDVQQQIDLGLTRLDQTAMAGQGLMVDITVVIDDISGKKEGVETMLIQLENILLLDDKGNSLSVAPLSNELFVNYDQATNVGDVSPPDWQLYPQPAQDRLEVQAPRGWRMQRLAYYDLQGRVLWQMDLAGERRLSLNVQPWPRGIGWLRIFTDQGIIDQKIVIR